MTDILEQLAAKVEALDGPCRSIFDDAARLIIGIDDDCPESWSELRWQMLLDAEAWLDAAMTLVGPEWTYIKSDICARGTPDQHCSCFLQRLVGDDEETVSGFAKHPALALVAAALRAKGGEQHGG